MLEVGAEVLVHFPDESPERLLYPAQILDRGDDAATLKFEGEKFVPNDGQALIVYRQTPRVFMQQPAELVNVLASSPNLMLQIRPTEDAATADARKSYRVMTHVKDLTVKLDGERDCPLLDLSVSGLALLARKRYRAGDVAEVTFQYQGNAHTGFVTVQSVTPCKDGRSRIGLKFMPSRRRRGRAMLKAARELTMMLQREQLRHLSRAG